MGFEEKFTETQGNCQKLAYEYVKEADKTMQEARDMIEKFEADKGAE